MRIFSHSVDSHSLMARLAGISRRKQPLQARSRKTVEAILTATSRVLVREGYEATTTTRVAEVAGVSIGSLYQYFPSKESLVAALVEAHIAKILELLAAATADLPDAPLHEAVRVFIRTVLLAHAVDPKLHAVLTQHFPQVEGFAKVRQLNRHAQALVLAYLEQHRRRLRPKNLELATFILVHCVQAVVSAVVLERPGALDDEALVDELALLVVRFLQR
jgi:AcrR family transcriptional regulator